MLSKTYDALLGAGAPEVKARKAAQEIAAYDFVLLGGVAALIRLLH
jgi:hypothetical protein